MRAAFRIALAALFVVALAACATVNTGADPALVHAEQAIASALDVTSLLVQVDYDQAAACRQQNLPVSAACSPLEAAIAGAHKAANDIRTLAPAAFTAANGGIQVYREAVSLKRAIDASGTATADQKAAAAAAVTDALGKLNASLANLAVFVAEAESTLSNWKGAVK
jgi:hypothetical protein